ncbi:hypothetical protein SAMN05446927_3157 [Caballeronia arationis]|jgi:hypothetical protein|uniref:Uncharacterized protein n=1 Tax=Caballeronia arationis TaxID=1777142 RepID=A0A7Z7I638_9BURK|nr:hypothetical protein [Caballeronia arationis]SOE66828.1 hypothetical protein SAMN05446927_3157 [Caballeronia arationis]
MTKVIDKISRSQCRRLTRNRDTRRRSPIGQQIVELLLKTQPVIEIAALDTDVRETVRLEALHQTGIWYYG